jgi:hypothetical protein
LRKSEELLLNILSQDPLAKFTSSNVSKFLESPKASDSSLSEPKEEEKPEDVEVKVDREWLRNTLARLQICRGLIEVPLQVILSNFSNVLCCALPSLLTLMLK